MPAAATAPDGQVRSRYVPRDMFLPFHNRRQRFACMVTHRRAGKTVAAINELVTRALYSRREMSRYGYVAPFRQQAKNVAWEYLKHYTEGMCEKVSESELYVQLAHNHARISIFGADNQDAFLGMYFDGLVIDEYGTMDPMVWRKTLSPTLADRKGWVVFIGTPNGRNDFYEIFNEYQTRSDCFTMLARVTDTGVFTAEEIEAERVNMRDDDLFRQEFMCDFSAALVKGAYYAPLLEQLEAAGHFDLTAYDPERPVKVVADIGITDSTAMWFWQESQEGFVLIDFYRNSGVPLPHYLTMLIDRGYRYERIYLPHDAKAKSFQTGRSTIEQFMEAGFPVDLAPRLSIQDGINAARKILVQCWFTPNCREGIDALRSYRRKWDEARKVFLDEPLHDWASDPADAFRYFALVAQLDRPTLTKKVEWKPEVWTLNELFEQRERIERRKNFWGRITHANKQPDRGLRAGRTHVARRTRGPVPALCRTLNLTIDGVRTTARRVVARTWCGRVWFAVQAALALMAATARRLEQTPSTALSPNDSGMRSE